MPQRLLTVAELRFYGLTPAEVRGAPRQLHETWRLSPRPVDLLKGVLAGAGFNAADPIHVHESIHPTGFVFTQ